MSRINHLYEDRYQVYTYAHRSWPLISEGYLACDMRPRVLWSHSKDS